MVKPIIFSFESEMFDNRPKDSLKSMVESFAYEHDVFEYIETAYEDLRGTDAFRDLIGFKQDFDKTIGSSSKTGGAFLDGAVLALDSINIFAPKLMPLVHLELALTRMTLVDTHLNEDPSLDDEMEYLAGIRMIGGDYRAQFADDFGRVNNDLIRFRAYNSGSHRAAIIHGGAFVLDAAGRAYERDTANLLKEIETKPANIPSPFNVNEQYSFEQEVTQMILKERQRRTK